MINTKTDRKNLYLSLTKIDLVKKLSSILGPGGTHHLRLEDGNIVPNMPAKAPTSPWVNVKVSEARCDIYHRILFTLLNHIPSYCRECYKVVVMPRTLVELFDLYELQKEMGVPCKCGIEKRLTDTRLYGGYFYCVGMEEGKKRYKEVRTLVNKHLSPKTGVILKRYCTEFEIGPTGQGPSDKLPELTEHELRFEKYLIDRMPRVGYMNLPVDHLTASTMVDWIHHAYMHGDSTYSEFTDGNALFKPVVTYHKTEKEK